MCWWGQAGGKVNPAVPTVFSHKTIDISLNKKRNMIVVPQTRAHNLFTSILHLCYDCHQFNSPVFNQRISLVLSLSSHIIQFYDLVLHRLVSPHAQICQLSFSWPGIGWLNAAQLQTYSYQSEYACLISLERMIEIKNKQQKLFIKKMYLFASIVCFGAWCLCTADGYLG